MERLTTDYMRISLSNRTDDMSVTYDSKLSINSNGKVMCSDDVFVTWDIQRHHGRRAQ